MRILHDKGLTLFSGPREVLSNWHRSVIVVDRVAFSCLEQYMMAAKAKLFGDVGALARIMGSDDPRVQKAAGREVTPYVDEVWVANQLMVMYRGNLAKYQQHAQMGQVLLSTRGTWTVEASQYDGIWGIKLGIDNPLALDPSKWRGFNRLGKTLDSVRATIELPRELQAEFAEGVLRALARLPQEDQVSVTWSAGYAEGTRLHERCQVFAA